jgi:DNA-directed RNA polymerase II subunit RPB1
MSLADHVIYDENVRPITGIQFGVLSPEEIISHSVASINNHIIGYKKTNFTVHDGRLGAKRTSISSEANAITGLHQKFDPGNFGHCILPKPVFHPLYMPYVRGILKLVCPNCSALRFDKVVYGPMLMGKTREVRQTILKGNSDKKIKLVKECLNCGMPQPESVIDDKSKALGLLFKRSVPKTEKTSNRGVSESKGVSSETIDEQLELNSESTKGKRKIEESIDPEHARRILEMISDEDCELIGYNPKITRPEWMITTVVAIPPPSVRPFIVSGNGKISEDDLTTSINNLIKHANILRVKISESANCKNDDGKYINAFWQTVQLNFATLIDNETARYKHAINRAHRPLKTIRERHKGKHGRIRWNLMGKRVNSSARSVITPDPLISIDEVGIPVKIAMVLTYPVIVTIYNHAKLATLALNTIRHGKDFYPGVKQIKFKGKDYRIDMSFFKKEEDFNLQVGSIVYRHLLDGDVTFFNRQPSLHKMSMMCHYARVMTRGNTFRLNVNVTPPYGADFDGDEMNLHVPQTPEASIEIERLARVSTQIVSMQASKPVIGAVQDSLLGAYRMTNKEVQKVNKTDDLNPREFMRLSCWVNNSIGNYPEPKTVVMDDNEDTVTWTNNQIFSMMLPPISMKNGSTVIKHGNLSEDQEPITKKVLGKSASGGIIHVCWRDMGPLITRDFMDNLSRITAQWLMLNGYSVGTKDFEIPQKTTIAIEALKKKYIDESKILLDALHTDNYDDARVRIIKQPRGLSSNDSDQFELDIQYHLGQCKSKIETITVNDLGLDRINQEKDNRLLSMTESGSKGSKVNVVHIAALLGQQDVLGHRIEDGYSYRAMPYAVKGSLTPVDRGWVADSYSDGLNPISYFIHCKAGRNGVISTSIKTAETGYVQRKLIKVMEDYHNCYDGTVRNANNRIVQYCYADGFDGARIEPQRLDLIYLSDDQFLLTYLFSKLEQDGLKHILDEATYNEFNTDLDEQQAALDREFNELTKARADIREIYSERLPDNIYSPVNFKRLIKDISHYMRIDYGKPSNMTPKYIINEVSEMIKEIIESFPSDNQELKNLTTKEFIYLIRSNLSSKKMLYKEFYNKAAFTDLIIKIKMQFHSSLINPGESTGIQAAQSIGEPSTQLTLDTFHHTGVGSKGNVSRGVPRLKELLDVSSNPKTPSITTYIEEGMLKYMTVPGTTNKTINDLENQLISAVKSGINTEELKILKTDLQKDIIKAIRLIKAQFEYVQFENLVTKTEIIYDNGTSTDDDIFERSFWTECDKTDNKGWIIRYELDSEKMRDHNITVYDITKVLKPTYDCIFSNDSYTNESKVNQVICRIGIGEIEDPNTAISHIENSVMKTKIKGIIGIKNTSIRIESKDIKLSNGQNIGKFDEEYSKMSSRTLFSDNYVIDTVGSNLVEVLNMPYVDPTRTYSNDINEMKDVFGIEVARQCLVNEIYEVITYNGAGLSVRHIELLADVMTSGGIIQAANRFGLKKGETGPIAMASFEETTPLLFRAAALGQHDNMKGVSPNIMFGQFIKHGTNAFTVMMDEDKIERIDTAKIEMTKSDIMIKEAIDKVNFCKKNEFEFDFDFDF